MFGNKRESFLTTGAVCDLKPGALEKYVPGVWRRLASSSMIRICHQDSFSAFLIHGQPDAEYGSAFRIVLCLDAAMVLLDDVMSDSQPETCPCVLACYKRVKNSGQDFCVNSWPRILHREKDFVLCARPRVGTVRQLPAA